MDGWLVGMVGSVSFEILIVQRSLTSRSIIDSDAHFKVVCSKCGGNVGVQILERQRFGKLRQD